MVVRQQEVQSGLLSTNKAKLCRELGVSSSIRTIGSSNAVCVKNVFNSGDCLLIITCTCCAPSLAKTRINRSINGTPCKGSRGLGKLKPSFRNRDPSPAAMIANSIPSNCKIKSFIKKVKPLSRSQRSQTQKLTAGYFRTIA
ncbi:hypothetical protein D3C81_1646250 [compost metagenome]